MRKATKAKVVGVVCEVLGMVEDFINESLYAWDDVEDREMTWICSQIPPMYRDCLDEEMIKKFLACIPPLTERLQSGCERPLLCIADELLISWVVEFLRGEAEVSKVFRDKPLFDIKLSDLESFQEEITEDADIDFMYGGPEYLAAAYVALPDMCNMSPEGWFLPFHAPDLPELGG